MSINSIRSHKAVAWFAWILVYAMISSGASPAMAAECTDLAEIPLMVSSALSAPPLFMISFDNSASMDFEVMAKDGVEDSKFADPISLLPYGYVFKTSQHNNNADVVELKRPGAWKSQWHEHNRLYYNPEVIYSPWPYKTDVTTVAPITDTLGETYDLTADFMTGIKMPKVESVIKDQEVNGVNNGTHSNILATVTVHSSTATVYIAQEVTCANGRDAGGNYCFDSDELSAGSVQFINTANSADVVTVLPGNTLRTGPDGGWIPYTDGYLTDKPGFFTATWRLTGLTAGQTYTVRASWNAFAERSKKVAYNISYGSGETINIKRRHFYVKSDPAEGGDGYPYLVNLNTTMEFYKVMEGAGVTPDVVENFELIRTDWANLPVDLKVLIPESSYADQLQNFANWFKYYRKRTFAARNAVAVVAVEMSNVLMGFLTNPPTTKCEVRWINSNFAGASLDNTSDFLNLLYNAAKPSSQSTFASTLLDLGNYFEDGGNITDAGDMKLLTENPSPMPEGGYFATSTTYPFFTKHWGGECQQAIALIITDGGDVANSSVEDYDSASTDSKMVNSDYDGGIFADAVKTKSGTMADAAMKYYERDLKPALANLVPANYMDFATHQHMVTYGITFGVEGEIDRDQYPNCTAECAAANSDDCTCPPWPDPHNVANGPNRGLDDMWHSTVNGRGLFLNAADSQELIEKLKLIKNDIERRAGSAAAVATNAVQRQYGATIYQGRYDSTDWEGDLKALQVDPSTGNVGSYVWTNNGKGVTAGELLNIRTTPRNIFTYDGSDPLEFVSSNAGLLSIAADEINYLRGDHSLEQQNGVGNYRNRDHVLGDVVNSEPYFYNGVVYIGANDAMLHAFDSTTGEELFAYVPHIVHGKLDAHNNNGQVDLTEPSYDHETGFYVDATPYVNKVGNVIYLAGGLGKGGKGIYCLKVDAAKSNPTPAGVVNWEFSEVDDPDTPSDLGYVYGRAYVINTRAGAAVIFGNGYNSASEKAVLYVLSAATGEIIKKFQPQQGGGPVCNGMSSPAIVDYNLDGLIDYIYAGDLNGNLWKFDLTDATPANWVTSYNGNPLFQAKDVTGKTQPITCEPDVMFHCEKSRKGFIVVFGTGKLLGQTDMFDESQQTFYGIYDWERDGGSGHLGYLSAEAYNAEGGFTEARLSNVTQTLVKQDFLKDVSTADGLTTYRVLSDNAVSYYYPENPDADSNHVGWYLNMPNEVGRKGEKIVANPLIHDGVVTFVSNKIEVAGCMGSGFSFLYSLDACSGGHTEPPQFDINGDGKFNDADKVVDASGNALTPSGQKYDTILYRPVQLGDTFYINNTLGGIEQNEIPPNPIGMKYWRLIE